MKSLFTRYRWIGAASVVTLLLVWKVGAVVTASSLLVPHPEDTLRTVIAVMMSPDFLKIAGTTILRGLWGFALSAILGIGVGIAAGISHGFNAFINPLLVTVRSTPVISLILLALIWLNPGTVPVFIAFLTMFPFICTNVTDGIRSVDPGLVEMARFYRVGRWRLIGGVYVPAIMPFIISGASSALGFGWRAIIIGEVLSQPRYGIGTTMQSAQTFLNVEAVIAWTLIAVVISYVFEQLIRWWERRLVRGRLGGD